MSEPIDKDTRGATNLRIKFRSANLDEFIERYAVDVSRGGIFIRTREPLSVGSRLKLDFQLLEAGPLIEGEGTVVWIRQPDPARAEVTPGMGVRFDKLTADSQARLDRILSEKDRLAQAGKAPGMSKTGGGMAVRRPTGTFAPIDGAGAKPIAPAPPAPPAQPAASDPRPAPAPPRFTGAMPTVGGTSPLRPTAAGFGRPRTTTGGMQARSAPVPSSLFEPPTADDIDRALSVLEDKPGPLPVMPPTPRIVPAVPIAVADDASNEPTRVVSDPQEFGAHEAVTGKGASILPESDAPEPAGDDLTAPVNLDEEGTMATMAASPAAFAAAERALGGAAATTTERKSAKALDAVVPDNDRPSVPPPAPTAAPPAPPVPLPGALRRKSAIVEAAVGPTESGRFRTNATYKRPRKTLRRVVTVMVVVAAAGGAAFTLRHRIGAMLASPEVATKPAPPPAPATEPTPSAAPEAGVGATAAGDAGAVAAAGTPGGATAPAPTAEAVKVGGGEKPAQPEAKPAAAEAKPAVTEAKPAAEEPRPKRRRIRPAAAEGEAAKPEGAKAEGAAPEAAKPETAKPDDTKAAEKPAGEAGQAKPALAEGAAAAAPAGGEAAPAAGPATLKVTSIPGGAEVIIDGTSMGTTPFSSKDVDPTASHAITIKKDGFDAQERTIGAANWSHPKSGLLYKLSVKLKRTAAEAPKQEPKASDVEIITPD